MSYTITNNAKFNSIEILFDAKPSEAVRSALKSLKFRWHNQRGVWYGYQDEATVREAINNACPELVNNEAEQIGPVRNEAPKATKVDRDMLRAEFAKAWKDPRMVDYCTNKVASVAVLPTTGEIITFDKMSIETRFCFGESGYDAEDARKMAAHARTSCDYFKEENMRAFKQWLDNLEDARALEGRYVLTISGRVYTGQTEDCRLRYIRLERISKVIDDLGGSAFLADLPGQTVTENGSGRKYRIATAEELEAITNACKQAAAAHEKKVDAYLKRYGTSKVHAWTYWRDA